jgi:SAM-dependent methyltransferase
MKPLELTRPLRLDWSGPSPLLILSVLRLGTAMIVQSARSGRSLGVSDCPSRPSAAGLFRTDCDIVDVDVDAEKRTRSPLDRIGVPARGGMIRPKHGGGRRQMKPELAGQLLCPLCGGAFDLTAEAESTDGEVLQGAVTCTSCGSRWAILDGVPSLVGDPGDMSKVQRSFGFQWTSYYQHRFEQETVFGRTSEQDLSYFLYSMGLTAEDIRGKRILDAGCGCGRLTRMLGELGAAEVVGFDISDAAIVAYDQCRQLPNVNILQADIFHLPFRAASFDLVWSNGVIHHTPDARRAHQKLSEMVSPGGSMYVWVYSTDFNPFRFIASGFKTIGLRPRLQGRPLLALCNTLSVPSMGALKVYQAAHSLSTGDGDTVRAASRARTRTLSEIAFTWHDSLSPEFDSRHTRAEVVGWFVDQCFDDVTAIDYEVPCDSEELAQAMFGAASGVGVRGRRGLYPNDEIPVFVDPLA